MTLTDGIAVSAACVWFDSAAARVFPGSAETPAWTVVGVAGVSWEALFPSLMRRRKDSSSARTLSQARHERVGTRPENRPAMASSLLRLVESDLRGTAIPRDPDQQ